MVERDFSPTHTLILDTPGKRDGVYAHETEEINGREVTIFPIRMLDLVANTEWRDAMREAADYVKAGGKGVENPLRTAHLKEKGLLKE